MDLYLLAELKTISLKVRKKIAGDNEINQLIVIGILR